MKLINTLIQITRPTDTAKLSNCCFDQIWLPFQDATIGRCSGCFEMAEVAAEQEC